MPVKDHHDHPYDKGTKLKLDIYGEYLRSFLHNFLNASSTIKAVQLFDFFSGPGHDLSGEKGSPLIALDVIQALMATNPRYRSVKIRIVFNELDREKNTTLSSCIEELYQLTPNVVLERTCKPFHAALAEQLPTMLGCANLVFLDQNGIKETGKDVIAMLSSIQRTDILFFLASATVNRFKEKEEVRRHVPLTDEDIQRIDRKRIHRYLAETYRRWISPGRRYYLGSFSFLKGANVYGLVFGSEHPKAIELFLQIAWKRGGDADFDIDDDHIDPEAPALFDDMNKPKKVKVFQAELCAAVLERRVKTNKDAYLYALENGCLGKHAKEELKRMCETNLIPKQSFAISYDAWHNGETRPILLFNEAMP